MPNARSQRKIDIVISGATGFTGQLAAEYLANHKADLKVVLAGRNKSKLDDIANKLPRKFDTYAVQLDEHDKLVDLFSQAKVVMAMAGPYAKLGEPIVRACVAAQTIYLDLTGEPQFQKLMLQKYEAEALANGTLLVHGCGCDSIPYDWVLYFAASQLAKDGKPKTITRVRTAMKVTGGSFSGGTFLSLLNVFTTLSWKELISLSFDREYLSPIKSLKRRYKAPGFFFFESWRFGGIWAASLANRANVYRTRGLLELRARTDKSALVYGNELDYDDFVQTPDPISGTFISLAITLLAVIALVPGGARFLEYVGPKSGSGPDKKTRDSAVTTWQTFIYTADQKVQVNLRVNGDAGYKGTAAIMAEAAIASTKRKDDAEGGFLPPALALGPDFGDQLSAQDKVFQLTTKVTRR